MFDKRRKLIELSPFQLPWWSVQGFQGFSIEILSAKCLKSCSRRMTRPRRNNRRIPILATRIACASKIGLDWLVLFSFIGLLVSALRLRPCHIAPKSVRAVGLLVHPHLSASSPSGIKTSIVISLVSMFLIGCYISYLLPKPASCCKNPGKLGIQLAMATGNGMLRTVSSARGWDKAHPPTWELINPVYQVILVWMNMGESMCKVCANYHLWEFSDCPIESVLFSTKSKQK